MEKKSNEIRKEVKIALIKKGKSQAEIARELGLTRHAVSNAIRRCSGSGKVYEWIKSNLKIDLKQTA